MHLSPRKQLFVDTASEMFGNGVIMNKTMTRQAAEKADVPFQLGFGVRIIRLLITNLSYLQKNQFQLLS